jgi:phenylalanyl-tRNA synthetase alpha chain
MALTEFLAELEAFAREATAAFHAAGDADALEAARIEFLGARQGRLKAIQKGLGGVDKADKPAAGKSFNETKAAIEAAFRTAEERMASRAAASASPVGFDPTVPGVPLTIGHLHPITQTIAEIADIMGRLGFTVVEGPEVEDEWHNFEALNIPPAHPARDPLENFYLAAAERHAAAGKDAKPAMPRLLRSQTSTVQIRVMEKTRPPVRVISLGRVYRPDTPDPTHVPMFHQIEGLLVDRDVTMADLKSILRLFGLSYFEDDVHIRFRPSFFPFTEPSVEIDMSWHGGWMEMGGAGMVDPNVLAAVGYDPEEFTGLAFGLGIERMCARRHAITDIREFYKNDVRFLHQF